MSYILDALKKSEAERSRGVVPTLLAPQQTPLRKSVIGWLIAGALLINAIVLGAWFYRLSAKAPSPPPSASVSTLQTPAPSQPAPPPAATALVPAPAQITERVEAAPLRPALPSDAEASSNVERPDVVSPISTSKPVTTDVVPPRYQFSTHVYASDPSMRAVTLNGKRYAEGDMIDPGVRIKEITDTGVILDIDGQSVPVDVLQDWR